MKKKKTAQDYENKGNEYFEKGNIKKALEQYKLSLDLDPNNTNIYDKLIETHQKLEKEWEEEDFTEHLSWMMKKQELENPSLVHVHERLTPEYESIKDLIASLVQEKDEEKETDLINQITSHEKKALLPLIDFVLQIKSLQNIEEENEEK